MRSILDEIREKQIRHLQRTGRDANLLLLGLRALAQLVTTVREKEARENCAYQILADPRDPLRLTLWGMVIVEAVGRDDRDRISVAEEIRE